MMESSPYNFYRGPEKPEVLIITSGSGWMYSLETVSTLKLQDRVGLLKLSITWPLPRNLLLKHLKQADAILFVEEVDPFLENNVKELFAQHCMDIGLKRFYGKATGTVPSFGEITPEIVTSALGSLLKVSHEPRPAEYAEKAREAMTGLVPARALGFCAGCPHRATYWAIKRALPWTAGMGSCSRHRVLRPWNGSLGILSDEDHPRHGVRGRPGGRFGQLERFGLTQPVLAVCGDSTFYHAAMPALVSARYNSSSFLLLLLDNSATAMTGFQPHPGTGRTAQAKRRQGRSQGHRGGFGSQGGGGGSFRLEWHNRSDPETSSAKRRRKGTHS